MCLLNYPLSSDGQKDWVNGAKVLGTLTDLYDFEYSIGNSFNGFAAAVQAGYPILGQAGHLFKVEVNMNNTIAFSENLGVVA